MHRTGVTPNKPYKILVSSVTLLGKYHPHGDSSVYDATVRLAQISIRATSWWTVTVTLVPSVAIVPLRCVIPKYVWQNYSKEMLADIDEETVDFMPNYDESLQNLLYCQRKVPKSSHQWFQRYRRRDGDKYSAAQP